MGRRVEVGGVETGMAEGRMGGGNKGGRRDHNGYAQSSTDEGWTDRQTDTS